MSKSIEIVQHYSREIRNDRTPMDALEHLEEEVAELKLEIKNGNTGPDGVKGETIDVVNCALDVLFLVHPEITIAEIDALMEAKCRKWMAKYSKHEEAVTVQEMTPVADILKEFKECEVSISVMASVADIAPSSVRRIASGSLASSRTQKRLNDVFSVLKDAFEGYYWGISKYWRKKSRAGQTLQELLSAPVVDLLSIRAYLKEFEPAITEFKAGYVDYRRENERGR
ncbi:hypothetical protein G6L37_06265 [Agrobacterium rubi]|nr:hypothetical protein [Agrobacterium rubi]NTF24966.1 hypothetical protein [Agrobacterium rubi]